MSISRCSGDCGGAGSAGGGVLDVGGGGGGGDSLSSTALSTFYHQHRHRYNHPHHSLRGLPPTSPSSPKLRLTSTLAAAGGSNAEL